GSRANSKQQERNTDLSGENMAIWGNRFHGWLRAYESSGKLSGEGGREGSSQDTRRVSRRLAGVRQPVLHHQRDGRNGTNLPGEGVDRDGREAGKGVQPEPGEAQIFEADELLRANG